MVDPHLTHAPVQWATSPFVVVPSSPLPLASASVFSTPLSPGAQVGPPSIPPHRNRWKHRQVEGASVSFGRAFGSLWGRGFEE